MPPEVVRADYARQRQGVWGKQNGAQHNPNSAHRFLRDSVLNLPLASNEI
jgi:hypothetical protein